ncbi:MBL fold metallo-hydrolase [Persicobacter psychrovividus]|uniref:MBL fold metallo-hydrolase n=1 Tax=Persicobacter psychrovividus TaxID=387638 RepID=A0ABM7VJQ9_9BACT|nr:MBL fold metallo-hydrolase [Persicobacter psychrovividus]
MNAVEKLTLDGEIPVNCYVIARQGACYIVDPGYQKEKIQAYIAAKGYQVKGVLLTHGHIDHIEALDCFEVPIFIHEQEWGILLNNSKNGFDFFGKKPKYQFDQLDIRPINSSTVFPLGNEEISVYLTPGHTIGSVCYRIGHDLYTGDTLFEGTVGKWDRPSGNMDQLRDSVLWLIDSLPEHLIIHPGHGRSSTIGVEKQINPFYIRWRNGLEIIQ